MNYTQNTLEEAIQRFDETLELEIGSLYQAKSVERIPNAQDGGVVTSLLGYVLDEDLVKGAAVAGKDIHWITYPILVTDSSELKNIREAFIFP